VSLGFKRYGGVVKRFDSSRTKFILMKDAFYYMLENSKSK